MQLLNIKILEEFCKKHAAARKPLAAWRKQVSAPSCQWDTSQAINDMFASADFLANNRVIFNIGGNKYRLVVKVIYHPSTGIVKVDWIGTHAEYDKKTF